jgi:hypothetical protein
VRCDGGAVSPGIPLPPVCLQAGFTGRKSHPPIRDPGAQPANITNIRVRAEFVYLAVRMDVFTRAVRG